jgi:hypothetical protein
VRPRCERSRAGLSALEIVVGVALLAVVAAKVALISSEATSAANDDLANIVVEDEARLTLDRIAYAIMESDRSSIVPDAETPAFSSQIRYRVSLGVQGGVIVWDDPEQIALDPGDRRLRWIEDPGGPGERSIVWCDAVRSLLEGEEPNGVDDNGNGLIDESGLAFEIDGNTVTVTLTLEKPSRGGRTVISTVETTVTCRQFEP